jgi:ribosomal-protein-alanine N-acetyltransferase
MSLTQRAISAAGQGVSIQSMTEHDLLEVVEIEETTGLSRWGWAAYYSELQGSNRELMLVARLPEPQHTRAIHGLAGYIVGRIGADELHINNVAVREIYRRQGIGRALLNRILEAGKEVGIPRAFLELRAGNAAALALYTESGFRVTSRRGKYYTEPVEDALVMTIELMQNA